MISAHHEVIKIQKAGRIILELTINASFGLSCIVTSKPLQIERSATLLLGPQEKFSSKWLDPKGSFYSGFI